MWCLRLACLSLCLSLAPSVSTAQEAAPQPLTLEPSGEAYLKALGYRGIDTDVAYYDPTGKLPKLEAGQPPAPPPEAEEGGGSTLLPATIRIPLIIITAAILIGLAVLIFSGNFTLSLADAQNPSRSRRQGRPGALPGADLPADLQTILATADRRRALVLLVQAALARTVASSGVLLQPSWTLRDALTHIPRSHAHFDALRALVLAGERVLFGNRDVTEEDFQAHVARVRPLMTGAAA